MSLELLIVHPMPSLDMHANAHLCLSTIILKNTSWGRLHYSSGQCPQLFRIN